MAFHGWQKQPGIKTVQESLLNAIKVLLKDVDDVIGCGRTDTGVHAREFYAHFDTEFELPKEFLFSLNSILGKDIAIYNCFEVDLKDHARFSAASREYQYYLHFSKDPFINGFSAYANGNFDIDLMNEACEILKLYEDFGAFSKSNTQVFTNNCEIYRAEWNRIPNGIVFTIEANRFLRNMVRAVVGTMLELGENKISLKEFEEIIKSKNRSNAGKSVLACGLYLKRIKYPFINE